MSENVCPQCGAPSVQGATECKYCGEPIKIVTNPQMQSQPQPQQQPYQQPVYQQPVYQQPQAAPYTQGPYAQPVYNQTINDGVYPSWPIKNKIVAGLLAIFLGGFGIHKFYLGKVGQGLIYLLFCWTGIPAIIAFIEGIIYLCSNDHNFQVKHQVRLQ